MGVHVDYLCYEMRKAASLRAGRFSTCKHNDDPDEEQKESYLSACSKRSVFSTEKMDEDRNGVAERRQNYVSNYIVSEGNKLRKHPLILAESHIRS
ncbi:hypothetical protein J2T19_003602 [Paenibacillus tundrae]|uniref:Uncharacterized protein n=1 Tax=Paenibacillus tundrae TaxID=528187 RepID=A0ABT9WH32_9BACL|nr:hypothetical protein [Paenibacillus tundrae]